MRQKNLWSSRWQASRRGGSRFACIAGPHQRLSNLDSTGKHLEDDELEAQVVKNRLNKFANPSPLSSECSLRSTRSERGVNLECA